MLLLLHVFAVMASPWGTAINAAPLPSLKSCLGCRRAFRPRQGVVRLPSTPTSPSSGGGIFAADATLSPIRAFAVQNPS